MSGAAPSVGSESHGRADRNHRRSSCVHGFDDFAAVDALQVDGGDPEVAVAELALDHDQRHSFAGHFDGVGVAQLVRREAAPNPGRGGRAPQLRACRSGRPMAPARRAVDDAQQGTDGKLRAQLEPGAEFLPSSCVQADLTAAPTLAVPDQERAAPLVEIALGQSERLVDAQPCSPQQHGKAA